MANEHWGPALRHLHTVLTVGAIGALADGPLLERFRAGRDDADSSAAFAALVERHGPMVLRVCRDILHDLHDAEDASQATFLILAKKRGSIRRVDSLASWLFGVALRVSAKARAEAARRRASERRGSEMKARAGGEAGREGPWPELYEELDRLPEKYRAPIVLCHLEGLTNEQAASHLGLPVRTIQRRLAEGRERLRPRLVRRGLEPAVGLFGTRLAADAVSEVWLEATVRAASRLVAGQATAAVASAAVTALTQGVLTMMLISRLKTIAVAAVLVALFGAGAVIAARRQAEPDKRNAESRQAAAKTDIGQSPDPVVANILHFIKGVVVDAVGKPVAGAQVFSHWTFKPQPVTTKADGTFVIPNDEPRLLNLSFLATADGGARQGIFRFEDATGPKGPRTLVRIVLKPARVVTVSVVDSVGAPVEGAVVFVLDLVVPVAEARTDARGIATLRAPIDAMTMWIFGSKSGVGFDYFENYRSAPAMPMSPPPETARLVLDGARTVRLRAVDSTGRPVPGVELYPLTIQKKGKLRSINLSPISMDSRTDASGVATFDWLPANLVGGTSFYSASLSYYLPDPPILDVNKPQTELTVRVLRTTRVSGKVTLPDGSPASGILVEAQGVGGTSQPAGSGRARTAADGSYAMDLPPEQSYTIGVIDDEWASRNRSGVVVREGVAQTGLDVPLERGCLIRGRVTAGPESKPSPGRVVVLAEQGPVVPPGTLKDQPPNDVFNALTRICDTDEAGRYAFRVAPGTYQLRGPSLPGSPIPGDDLTIVAAQGIERNFSLPRDVRLWKPVRCVVRAKAADGPPIAGAVVVVQPVEGNIPPVQGYADDHGRIALPDPAGKSLVYYARNPEGNLAGSVTLGEDNDTEITIVAKQAATARGQVVDSSGKPRAGVYVRYAMLIELEGVDSPASVGQTVETDDQGRFTVPGLLIGARCKLFAYDPAGGNSPDQSFAVKDIRPIDLGAIVLDRRGAVGTKTGTR
jgi:RNA polymerase sigma factor (sigma-70 family)